MQEIDYPSREAIDEGLASPRRQAAMEALASVQAMYDGHHHYVNYAQLADRTI